MTGAHEQRNPQPQPTLSGRIGDHPAWCDPTRCIADPGRQIDGYQSERTGEHQSAPVPVRLTSAVLLPVRDGTAWLSQACAPWTCDTYLRMQVGDVHLSMPAEQARRVLADLSVLLSLAATEGVTL